MCQTCGCADTPDLAAKAGNSQVVDVMTGLLSANDEQAARNRAVFDRHNILAINLMSSPGAGKTSLLEATAAALPAGLRAAVIEGDLETENDAERVRRAGLRAVQINTGSACHLDAGMIERSLLQLDLHDIDVLFVENVGNLVCPASFDLGQHFNVALLSVPEGDDKPLKYPVMFRAADLVLLTKMDLAKHLPEFQPTRVRESLQQLAAEAPCLEMSARAGTGMSEWLSWIDEARHGH